METAKIEELVKDELQDQLKDLGDTLTHNEQQLASDIVSEMSALYYKKYKNNSPAPEIYERAIEYYRNSLKEIVESTQLEAVTQSLEYAGKIGGKLLSELGEQIIKSLVNDLKQNNRRF